MYWMDENVKPVEERSITRNQLNDIFAEVEDEHPLDRAEREHRTDEDAGLEDIGSYGD